MPSEDPRRGGPEEGRTRGRKEGVASDEMPCRSLDTFLGRFCAQPRSRSLSKRFPVAPLRRPRPSVAWIHDPGDPGGGPVRWGAITQIAAYVMRPVEERRGVRQDTLGSLGSLRCSDTLPLPPPPPQPRQKHFMMFSSVSLSLPLSKLRRAIISSPHPSDLPPLLLGGVVGVTEAAIKLSGGATGRSINSSGEPTDERARLFPPSEGK